MGTSGDLSLVRRAQLAVTAHIRHVYTDYDRLLKLIKWAEARKQVQQNCLDVLVQWRGDDDDDGEIADILQEVIVIPDDDDDDDDGSKQDPTRVLKRSNYNNKANARTDVRQASERRVIDNSPLKHSAEDIMYLDSESDEENAVQNLGAQSSHHYQASHHSQRRLEQMEAQRQRIWEEALDRGRKPTRCLPLSQDQHQMPMAIDQPQVRLRSIGRRTPPHGVSYMEEDYIPMPGPTRLIPLPSDSNHPARIVPTRWGYPRAAQQVRVLHLLIWPILALQGNWVSESKGANVEFLQEPDLLPPLQRLRHNGAEDRYRFTQAHNGRESLVPIQDRYTAQSITHNPDLEAGDSHYKSNVVLPSIESNVSESGFHRNIIPSSLQREELVTYPQTRLPEPSEEDSHYWACLDEGMQARSGRRILKGGHHSLRDEGRADGLKPENRDAHAIQDDLRFNEISAYHEHRRPPLEDERIIMLPPRSNLRHSDVSKPMYSTSLYEQRERQPDIESPTGHSEYPLSSHRIYGQPQSSRNFIEGAPLHRRQSGKSQEVSNQGPSIEDTLMYPLLDQGRRLDSRRVGAYPLTHNLERETRPRLRDSTSDLYDSAHGGSHRNGFVEGPGRNGDFPQIDRGVQYPSLQSLPDSWIRDRADIPRQTDHDTYLQYVDRQENPSQNTQRVVYGHGELASQGPTLRPGPEAGRVNPFGESRSSLRSRNITFRDYTEAENVRAPNPLPGEQRRVRAMPGQIIVLD